MSKSMTFEVWEEVLKETESNPAILEKISYFDPTKWSWVVKDKVDDPA